MSSTQLVFANLRPTSLRSLASKPLLLPLSSSHENHQHRLSSILSIRGGGGGKKDVMKKKRPNCSRKKKRKKKHKVVPPKEEVEKEEDKQEEQQQHISNISTEEDGDDGDDNVQSGKSIIKEALKEDPATAMGDAIR